MIDVDELRATVTLFSNLHNRIWHMESEFRIIRDLAWNMEDYFLERCIDFEKHTEKEIKKIPKYRRDELEEHLEDEYNVLLSMAVLTRHSLFTSTYSLLEDTIRGQADYWKTNVGSISSLSSYLKERSEDR